MPSTYTQSLRFDLQATGENLNVWGNRANAGVFTLADDAIAGITSFTLSGTKTLTANNGATDEARRAVLHVTGGTGGTVTIPTAQKVYIVRNAASGSVSLTTGTGLTATVVSGDTLSVICDGTNVFLCKAYDFAGNRLTSIGSPSTTTDAVNKAYADNVLVQANAYTDAVATASGNLPNQTGNAGKTVTTNGTVASWATLASLGSMLFANNLSDLTNLVTARSNLGLGNSAVLNIGTTASTVAAGDDSRIVNALQKGLNLGDIVSASSARINLGLGSAAVQPVGTFVQVANNLGDMPISATVAYNIVGLLDLVGTAVPVGYSAADTVYRLIADGRSLLRTAYPRLFAKIGTLYGSADGTHFNLPDWRSYNLVGADLSRGLQDGLAVGASHADQMQGHIHQYTLNYGGTFNGSYIQPTANFISSTTYSSGSPITDGTNGTPRTGNTTHGREAAVIWMIYC